MIVARLYKSSQDLWNGSYMKVTARDVAREAGVSPATVSLVFQQKPGVSRATRERVLEVAAELGYVYEARSNDRATSTILFVMYKKHGRVVCETPFFEELLKGVTDATYRHGYHKLAVSYFYGRESAMEQMKAIHSVRCAGIVLLATEAVATDVSQFERLGVPIVLLDSWFPTKSLDSVIIDNTRGAYDAVRYLVSKGHSDIGYLHCGVSIRNFLERQSGFSSAMREIAPRSEKLPPIVRVGSTFEDSYADMSAYLDAEPELPTAYFADNDIIAYGCIKALSEHGYRVPQDVSVIGFDDMKFPEVMEPRLTTMAVPKDAMGELAVKRLIDLIKGETNGETIRLAVQTQVVERDSVLDLGAVGTISLNESPSGGER